MTHEKASIANMAKTSLTPVGNSAGLSDVDSLTTRVHTRARARLLHRPYQRKGIPMHATMVCTIVPMLLVLTLALSFAGEPPTPQALSAPRIEGTYTLLSRQFPDGTIFRPPEVMGLWTYTKTHRNLSVIRKDATGQFASFSLYRETVPFSIRTDQIGGKDLVYDLSGQTRSAPVTVDGRRIQFTLLFESHALVFEGNQVTATAANNANVDIWEKVE
jgi:hypothetical protein